MTPELQADVPLLEVVLYATLNPALIGVAIFMGRKVDEPAKLLIASFAGAAAGFALLYVVTWLGILDSPRAARAAAGIFAASLIPGLFYAWIGSRFFR